MRNKIVIGLIIGTSIGGFGDLAMAKQPAGKGKKAFCDGKVANVIGTNKSDTIVINDDNTYTVNGGDKLPLTPTAIQYTLSPLGATVTTPLPAVRLTTSSAGATARIPSTAWTEATGFSARTERIRCMAMMKEAPACRRI